VIAYDRSADERVNWKRSFLFGLVHFMPLVALWTGYSWGDVALCVGLYWLRMFFITAGYHRYFAHRSYRTSRLFQFLLALGGATAGQKGPLWWAGHHRHHHRYSDMEEDIHSPLRGFWWSHMGWIVCDKYRRVPRELIEDFAKYPELRFLDRHPLLAPVGLAAACLAWGGWGALFIGFFLSTVLLYHGTFLVNSLAHVIGTRRYATTDTSRNSWLIALLTCGEGWHNNHHHFQSTANQGWFWWELDVSYCLLRLLGLFGLVWELRTPPASLLLQRRIQDGYFDVGMFEAYWGKALRGLNQAPAQLAAYCEGRRELLDDFVETARRGSAELLERARHQAEALGSVQGWESGAAGAALTRAELRSGLEDFARSTRQHYEELMEKTREQARERFEKRSRNLELFLGETQQHALGYCEAKQKAVEEILERLRVLLEELSHSAQEGALELSRILAELEARPFGPASV